LYNFQLYTFWKHKCNQVFYMRL